MHDHHLTYRGHTIRAVSRNADWIGSSVLGATGRRYVNPC